ncbi:4Fe-4S dicluster domain-containing protein [Limisalsivibrio acetivorans]|uniref:4Fe-4S dicluster domain-containing protein n=1 Tax=Limisalsivibrio acetivorans TaxID=1304888 RepID=UPI0003B6CB21|nr:4Fe-4S dicluster domain-containing protein [Limisalsivibrio acetivorans]
MTICYDTQSCIRCYSCMVNCSAENRFRLQRDKQLGVERGTNSRREHLAYIKPDVMEIGGYPESRKITRFHHCNHCEKPRCMDICPSNAIVMRGEGTVVINEKTCVGCRSCMDACPYDVPVYSHANNRTYKCIKCYDRVENGLKQACVEACPTSAMFSGEREEVIAEARERAARYSEITGEEYMVYGADTVNSFVGSLGWVTIAPAKDAEAYGLDESPYRAAVSMRDFTKKAGGILAPLTVAAAFGHFMYWLGKRKQSVTEESHD